MAEEQISQSPTEFIQGCVESLESGMPPEQLYETLEDYEPLREVFEKRKEEVISKLANPDEMKALLLEVLKGELELAPKRSTEVLQNVKSPGEIAARTKSLQEAQRKTDEAILKTHLDIKNARDTFAGRATDAWVKNLRQLRLEGKLEGFDPDKLEEKIAAAAKKVPLATTGGELAYKIIQADPELAPLKETLKNIAQSVETPPELGRADVIRKQTTRLIVNHPQITRIDTFVQIMAEDPKIAPDKAATLTLAVEGFSADVDSAVDITKPLELLSSVATNGFQKTVVNVLGALPQEVRDETMKETFALSWERVKEKAQQYKEQLGETERRLLDNAIRQGNQAFGAGRPGVGGVAAGFGRIVGDVVNPLFGKQIDQAMINEYLEVGKKVTITQYFTWRQAYVGMVNAHNPSFFHFALSEGGKWALESAGKRLVGAGAKKIAGAAAKGIFSKLSGTAIGAAIGSLIPIPGVGTAIGAILGFVGGKLVMPILRGFGSLIKNVFMGGFLTRLMTGQGTEGMGLMDWAIIGIILFAVGAPMLLGGLFNPVPSALVNMGGENDEEGGSAYIKIVKTASPDSFPDNNPGNVTYSISIQATGGDLTNIRITDVFSVFGGTLKITPPPISGAPSSLADGEKFSTTISVSLAGLKDSLVTNTITVTADAKTINNQSKQGETRSGSASVSIGKPPTGCFVFNDTPTPDAFGFTSGPWDDKSAVLNAMATLSRSSLYMAQLCSGGPINLWRVRVNFGGGSVSGPNGIFLYNAGVRGLSALYTLAHESGHVLSWRSGLFTQFRNEGIWRREGSLWTYPGYSGYTESEDFAETIADYVVYKVYVFKKGTARFSFLPNYPLHYDFAKRLFGIEY